MDGKRVLITGGSGFLGRGIMRYANRRGWNTRFTVFSRGEQNQSLCRQKFPDATYVLGDVRDIDRLALAMLGHDVVIHAAALKFIPEGEFNADECVRVNVDGARSVISAARIAGVSRVVGISTDKAAQPVNVYGMTKAIMERLFAEAGYRDGRTWFTTCRYGNVIGSTGSVVPVMIRQYHDEGQIKITDPHMTRFWMPIDMAVKTIVHALEAPAGSTTIPNPMSASMWSVAQAVLQVVGAPDNLRHCSHNPMHNIHDDCDLTAIRIIGRRPGEKTHEDMVSEYEMLRINHLEFMDFMELMPPGYEHYEAFRTRISSNEVPRIDTQDLRDWINEALEV